VAAVDGGLIVTLHGSSTLVTPDGRRRSVGRGEVLGGSGHAIARITCERLECHVTVDDLATGNSRRIAAPIENAGGALFAAGGRWMQLFRSGPDYQPLTLVDLRTMRVNELDSVRGPTAFTADGSYLLAVDGGMLRAYDLDAKRWIDLNQIGSTAGQLVTTAS
jgi:hypothetical protein